MRLRRGHAFVCVWAATSLALQGCQSPAPAVPISPPPGAATAATATAAATAIATGGRATIDIDGSAHDGRLVVDLPDPRVTTAPVTVQPLVPDETTALLARMEPPPVVDNRGAPPLRAPTVQPPRGEPAQPIAFVITAGKQVADLPPGTAPPAAASVHPLTPPQISPQGEVAHESEVRVRFDEPMVPVGQVGAVAVPLVTIAPAVPGAWHWIDTRVLELTPKGARLPQATEFTITVPAGTRAVSGDALAEPAIQTFTTPPVAIYNTFPSSGMRPDSAIAIRFDQDIDPARLAPLLQVAQIVNGRARRVAFHVVTLDQAEQTWAKNPFLQYDPARMAPNVRDRAILIAPDAPWPSGMAGVVTLAAGAPSREGPRTSAAPNVARFDVAPELRMLGIACGSRDTVKLTGSVCPAHGYLRVEMSNNLAPASYRAQDLQIDGAPFDDNEPSLSTISLLAPRPVGHTYGITMSGAPVDIYGQPFVGARHASFATGPEEFDAMLTATTGLQVLDPRFEIPQWVVSAQAVDSLHVQLYQVEPADYFAYEDFEAGGRATPPGKRVYDKQIEVGPRHGVEARIDLRPALAAAGTGHVIAVATVTPHGPAPEYFPARAVAWFQVTRLGVVGRVDGDKAQAWVRDISPASFLAPIASASASIITDDRATSSVATTDAEGHAALALIPPVPPAPPAPSRPVVPRTHSTSALLAIKTATDSTFVAMSGDGHQLVRERNAMWYATDDRFTYKPGETVYAKGWVRWTNNGTNPDIELPAANDTIAYTLRDAGGNKLANGVAPLTDQGGFDVSVAIPANANLGTATFDFATHGDHHQLPIAIQEFRAPAFAVDLNDDVTHAGATPLVLGERIEMRTEAKYYAGGGLPGAAVRWVAQLTPTRFQPPGWDEYDFSPPSTRATRSLYRRLPREIEVAQEGSLSGASAAGAVFGIAALPEAWPAILSVDATVSDVDRMAIRATSRPILVHPSEYYVGVRLRPDNDDEIQLVVSDIDGNAVPGVPITLDIEGVLGSEQRRNDAHVIDTQHCAVTSAVKPVTCAWHRTDFKIEYTATARIADHRGRANVAQYDIPWVTWEKDQPLQLTPDRASYRPGEVAKIALVSDVVPATAIVSFTRNGVIAQKRLELTAATTTIELPIEPAYIANVHVDVDRIAKRRVMQDGSKLPLPEHTQASIDLPVSIESARLVMTARPTSKIVEPGAEATFDVSVARDGAPVAGAEVALMVVDEAILSLSQRQFDDPLPAFYRTLDDGTWDASSIELVTDSGLELAGVPGVSRFLLDELTGHGMSGYGVGGGGAGYGTIGHGSGGTIGIVKARKDFRANAVFSPRLHTDASGHVSLTIKMPDSLTRFRIIALATASTRYFGKAEGVVVTQRKINARTVAPRFLTQGDAFALPIVVQNLDSVPRTVDVAVRPVNLVATGAVGKRVTIGAGQRAELRFDFRTAGRGTAIVQTIATSGDFADASNVQFPVYEPATTEAFATYGVVDDAAKIEQLAVPADVFPEVGGVQLEVASTQLQTLTDAFNYLYAYPYECAEQRSSRMLATLAMSDVLDAFATPGRPPRAELVAQLAADQKVLAQDQVHDGGWGYWPESKSDPYVTQQVLQAIAGTATGGERKNAIAYVTRDGEDRLAMLDQRRAHKPTERDPRENDGVGASITMAAADLTALASAGIDVHARAKHLHDDATALAVYPVDAKARLLALVAGRKGDEAMRGVLLADLLSATHETASSATVTSSFVEAERMLLVSSTKTSALALEAIMREAPSQEIVTKLARGLLDARRRGRWGSTQENLEVLIAMRHYFDTYEKATPNFIGKLWLGGAGYAERAFAGHTMDQAQVQIGWADLAAGTTSDLAFAKDGPGRMYYRVGITYAPKRFDLPALDAGFLVRRGYAAVDDPGDVTRGADGRWHIKLGARVLVTLEALNTTRRFDVAFVDPLPAGLEPINTALAVAERAVPGTTRAGWEHVNMRDDRAEAFSHELREGGHVFAYSARATTPGVFVAAPAKAEEMYAPETFGRSAGTVVIVE